MFATITPAMMNFPFSYPYDGDMSSQSIHDPLPAAATMTMEELLAPLPASVPLPLPQPQQHERHRQHPHLVSSNSPLQSSSPSPSTSSSLSSSSSSTYRSETSRWRALVARDPQATNAFVYAVVTTKIYCRPDCRARLARRANVRFFDQAAQAERGGFRACKRCRPNRVKPVYGDVSSSSSSSPSLPSPRSDSRLDSASGAAELVRCRNPVFIQSNISPGPVSSSETSQGRDSDADCGVDGNGDGDGNGDADADADLDDIYAKIQRAVHLIRRSASEKSRRISLSQLAGQVGLSKWHLQRVFKKLQGVTPREMAEQIIQAKAQAQVTVTAVTAVAAGTTTTATTTMTMPNDPVPTDTIHLCPFVAAPRPLSGLGTDELAFALARPPPPLPLMDTGGMDWFDDDLDSNAFFDYDHYHHHHHHHHQEEKEEEQQLTAPFADYAQTMDMTMAMTMATTMDMDMDLHAAAAAAAATDDDDVENILNDLFPEILVYKT